MLNMTSGLTAMDYFVVGGTIAILFAIGLLAGKRDETTHEFFLGGRQIPPWAACLSFVATEISAVTIISVPATTYKENWMYLQLFIGSFASRIALAYFFIPAFYKYNCTTIYEFLKHRFGPATQYTGTCFFFVTRLMGSGVRLTVASMAVAVLLGWPLVPTIIVFSIFSIVYISWGGIKSVVWTNVWQALIFIIGGLGTVWFLHQSVQGGLVGIFQTAFNAGKLKVFDAGPAFSDPGYWKAVLTNPNIWWLAILNGFFGSMAAYGTDHELMQRLLTVETRQKSQRTTLLTPVLGLGVLSIYLVIGSGLFAYYQQNPGLTLPTKLDDIFPHFANFQMPPFLRGLVLAAVIMASIDSPLGSLTASFVTDVYKPLFKPNESDRHYMRTARIMVVFFGILLGILAYMFSFLEGFLWWAFKIGGVTFGSLLGVFLFGLLTKRHSNRANIVSMVTMALVNLGLLILTEKKIFVVGWTWLVLLGTFGTMGLSALLGPVIDGKSKPIKTLVLIFGLFFSIYSPLLARVSLGIDVLEQEKFKILEGRRVALITNHTGVNGQGESTVDVLRKNKSFQLIRILSPEHGFRGQNEHGEKISNSLDPQTGLPVFSLYGATTRPTDEMLEGIDTLIFDIQDIGVRFYTYISTMGQALEEAAKRKIRFVVLDRPNPLRGDILEGDVLDSDIKRMTGYFTIPTRHGLTVGELAEWMNDALQLNADLAVVPLRRWKRQMWFDQTGLPFVAPSPNIKSMNSAVFYPGVGCFEATNISVGRGTNTPFELFGAPWIDGKALCAYLREKKIEGVLFEPITFTPTKDIYKDELCQGVRMWVTNRNRFRPFTLFVVAMEYLRKNYPNQFKPDWEEVRVVTGSDLLRQMVEGRISFEELFRQYNEALESFQTDVSSFFLY